MVLHVASSIDVIITLDDVAFTFMDERGSDIFGDIPFVFCGVNNVFEDPIDRNYTGLFEKNDFGSSIDLALSIHSDIENIYVINDDTITGKAIQTQFEEATDQYNDSLNFVYLNNNTIDEITTTVSNLDSNSIVLFLIYFQDKNKTKFSYDESVRMISNASSVPVYGMWESFLGHGIVGGNLASGYLQGEKVAEYASRILEGESPETIELLDFEIDNYSFDNTQLERFSISKDLLPQYSNIINETFDEKENILVLHSYHSTLDWVENIDEGIESVFFNDELYDITFDYMDTKRHVDPLYIQDIGVLLYEKYSNQIFDVVIVCDDNALKFAIQYRENIFHNTPIVFCGINNLDEYDISNLNDMSGVVEDIDIKSTLDIALEQNPNLKKVVVINDTSDTGMSNTALVEKVMNNYNDTLTFEFYSDLNMSDMLERVSRLNNDTCVLLMTFNKDKSNNVFDYKEVGELIASNSSVPVYVMWDFYLDTGVIGGMVTSGHTQGETAAKIALKVLNGTNIDDIDIIYESPNEYIFDYQVLLKYGLSKEDIPNGSIIINDTTTFYENYYIAIWILSLLIVGIICFYIRIRFKLKQSTKKQQELEEYALLDILTNIYQRKKGLELLEELIKQSTKDHPVSICFIDLDNLKEINDLYGHNQGDLLIKTAVDLINNNIRKSDIFMRLGGDEFLIAFEDATLQNAKKIMHKINGNIEVYNETESLKIAYSYGLAEYETGMKMKEFISIADKRMYDNKKAKKNTK